MKKPFTHKEVSSQSCIEQGCRRLLKKNLLAKNPSAIRCFAHHQEIVRKHPNYKHGRRLSKPVKNAPPPKSENIKEVRKFIKPDSL